MRNLIKHNTIKTDNTIICCKKRHPILILTTLILVALLPFASFAEDANEQKKEDFKKAFQLVAQQAPSERFVTGAVFDISRQYHSEFEETVHSGSALSLLKYFAGAYEMFCDHPEIVGLNIPVDREKEDTDFHKWTTVIFPLESGDYVAFCYMPIENDELEARIVGIILNEKGDGYYYCMLNKDENESSTVIRNAGMQGTTPVGRVKGRGTLLSYAFLNCIQEDFYTK